MVAFAGFSERCTVELHRKSDQEQKSKKFAEKALHNELLVS